MHPHREETLAKTPPKECHETLLPAWCEEEKDTHTHGDTHTGREGSLACALLSCPSASISPNSESIFPKMEMISPKGRNERKRKQALPPSRIPHSMPAILLQSSCGGPLLVALTCGNSWLPSSPYTLSCEVLVYMCPLTDA